MQFGGEDFPELLLSLLILLTIRQYPGDQMLGDQRVGVAGTKRPAA
jgi:hypothetical protein